MSPRRIDTTIKHADEQPTARIRSPAGKRFDNIIITTRRLLRHPRPPSHQKTKTNGNKLYFNSYKSLLGFCFHFCGSFHSRSFALHIFCQVALRAVVRFSCTLVFHFSAAAFSSSFSLVINALERIIFPSCCRFAFVSFFRFN